MPILDSRSLEFISRSTEMTRRVGMRLGSQLERGDVVCLIGDLGSGKTTLVQGLAAGWGSLDEVTSPTFVLVNVYRRPDGQRLYHLDAYRLSGASEAEDLDLEALLESGPLVVEWADRILEVLPPDYLKVSLQYINENQRDLVISANDPRYQPLVDILRRQMYGVRA
jgi:tRNA threonylcarbamoyladenosine biosynthesis protein TsaE